MSFVSKIVFSGAHCSPLGERCGERQVWFFLPCFSHLLTLEYADELGHSNHIGLKMCLKSKGKKNSNLILPLNI